MITSEELEKQLMLIFGYSNGKGIDVGEIIGIGKLSEQQSKELVFQTLQYLYAFNSMLRDYAGAEIFSIEFELEKIESKQRDRKILPQGMIFIPGIYKDCTSLLLLLSNELSLFDPHKSREELDRISTRFFEIQEIVERPELDQDQRAAVLHDFSKRFTYRLQASAIEHKWDRKLVGIRTDAFEDQMTTLTTINSKKKVLWHDKRRVLPLKPRFISHQLRGDSQDKLSQLRHLIQGPSLFYILQNATYLTANLMQIANSCTINDLEQQMVAKILDQLYKKFEETTGRKNIKWAIDEVDSFLKDALERFENHEEILDRREIQNRMSTISLEGAIKEYRTILHENGLSQMPPIKVMEDFIVSGLKTASYLDPNSVKLNEIVSTIHYVTVMLKQALKKIRDATPKFFYNFTMLQYIASFIENATKNLESLEFETERKLGARLMANFEVMLQNAVAEQTLHIPYHYKYTEATVFTEFLELAKKQVGELAQDSALSVEDHVHYAEQQLKERQIIPIQAHLEKFKIFEKEATFFLSYLLRHSSLNRFIREIPEEEIFTPESFSAKFQEFLRRRMGGLDLKWRDFFLKLILRFGVDSLEDYETALKRKRPWSNYDIIQNFTKYITDLLQSYSEPEGFGELLDIYSKEVKDITESLPLRDFKKYFRKGIEKKAQFSENIVPFLNLEIKNFGVRLRPQTPKDYIGEDISIFDAVDSRVIQNGHGSGSAESTGKNLRKYLYENELKYFAPIRAKPTRIILKSLEKKEFEGRTLLHGIELQYLGRRIKTTYKNNYLHVKSKFN